MCGFVNPSSAETAGLIQDECFGVLATLLPLVELADLSKAPSLLVSDALGSTSYV